jgi:hypothetical protein
VRTEISPATLLSPKKELKLAPKTRMPRGYSKPYRPSTGPEPDPFGTTKLCGDFASNLSAYRPKSTLPVLAFSAAPN